METYYAGTFIAIEKALGRSAKSDENFLSVCVCTNNTDCEYIEVADQDELNDVVSEIESNGGTVILV